MHSTRSCFLPGVKIISQQNRYKNHQAPKFPGIFYPWLFCLHGLYKIFCMMFCGPFYHTIFSEYEEQSISKKHCYSNGICPGIVFALKSKPAKHGCISINGDPDIRIRIIILQSGEQNKKYTAKQVKDLHNEWLIKSRKRLQV